MCGIFGYIGTRKDAATIVFEGIKTLEYRGYDSWGVAAIVTKKFFYKNTLEKLEMQNFIVLQQVLLLLPIRGGQPMEE